MLESTALYVVGRPVKPCDQPVVRYPMRPSPAVFTSADSGAVHRVVFRFGLVPLRHVVQPLQRCCCCCCCCWPVATSTPTPDQVRNKIFPSGPSIFVLASRRRRHYVTSLVTIDMTSWQYRSLSLAPDLLLLSRTTSLRSVTPP